MEVKKEFKWFTIFEYEKEQDYLREMHKAGWKFVKVTGLGMYHFEKCFPQDVIYQLDYNKDGLAHRDEYLKMFDDRSWEHIQDHFGYSYFRKVVPDDGIAEEIFCDDESSLQMMQRVLKRRMFIAIGVLLVLVGMILIWFHILYSPVKRGFQNDIDTLMSQNQLQTNNEVFTEEDSSSVPIAIQKYIQGCGYIGTPKMSYLRME